MLAGQRSSASELNKMWQPSSRGARSSSGGLARALLVLVRWAALITFVALVSFTALSSTRWPSASTITSARQVRFVVKAELPAWRRFQDGAAASGDKVQGGGGIVEAVRRRWRELHLYKGRRRQLEEREGRSGGALRMELRHRDAPGSPLRKQFSTTAQEVAHLLARDASRLAGMQRSRLLSEVAATHRDDAAAASNNFKAPLFSGSPLGTGSYLVDFYLGTPPRKLALIADTGSDLIWTQCAPCAACYPQLHPLFDPSNSSSFSTLPCDSPQCQLVPAPQTLPTCLPAHPTPCLYRYQYGGATSFTQGVFATDTATMKPLQGSAVKIPGIAFGCGDVINQGSFGEADGILGLGQGPISFPQQIRARYGPKFAYCLLGFSKPVTTTSLLVFGEQSDLLLADRASVPGSRIQYTRLLSNALSPTFYYVRPVKVSVGGNLLPIRSRLWQFDAAGNGGTVFESGVTLTYLVTSIYKPVYSAFEAAVHYPRAPPFDATLTLCFHVQGVKELDMPSLSIWFKDGAVYRPPTDNIFVNVGGGVTCLAIGEAVSPFAPNIFGNLLQQNFFIVYDPDRRRIGFAPSDCSF